MKIRDITSRVQHGIEFEFTVLNPTYLVRLSSYMYQYLKAKNLLDDFNAYLKNTK